MILIRSNLVLVVGLASSPLISKSNIFINGAIFPDLSDVESSVCGYSEAANKDKDVASLSGGGFSFIESIRQKPKSFYESIMTSIVIKTCDVDDADVTKRCVAPQYASLDDNGKCQKAVDSACPAGMCERQSNCYWKSIKFDQNRERRFSDDEKKNSEEIFLSLNSNSYIRSFPIFSYAGFICGIFCIIMWLLFIIVRFCCCCLWNKMCDCCSPYSKKEYNRPICQIALPKIIYFCSFLGVLGGAIILIVANNLLTKSVESTMQDLKETPSIFKSRMSNIIPPMYLMLATVEDSINVLQTIFPHNSSGFSAKAAFISDYLSLYGNATNISYINTLESDYAKFIQETENQISSISQVVNDDTTFLDAKSFSVAVDNTNLAIEESLDNMDDLDVKIEKLLQVEEDVIQYKKTGMNIFISFALSIILFGLLPMYKSEWICFQKYDFLNPVWVLSSILGTIGFFLAAITLIVGVANYDTCQVSDVAISNLEPLLGERIFTVLNACLSQENLLDAYGFSDNFDSLDNIATKTLLSDTAADEYEKTQSTTMIEIQKEIDSISVIALEELNGLTSSNTIPCPFNDRYSKETTSVPWEGKLGITDWKILSTLSFSNYSRQGDESNQDFMTRIYSVAGTCLGDRNCCAGNNCTLTIGDVCSEGTECYFPCSDLTTKIGMKYQTLLELHEMEVKMTSDLGLRCPEGNSCPSKDFKEKGHLTTVSASLNLAKGEYNNIISNTTEIMHELQNIALELACSLNCPYVLNQYDLVKKGLCRYILDDIVLLSAGFWVIAFSLNIAAIVAAILGVRLSPQQKNKPDISQYSDEEVDTKKPSNLEPVNTGMDISILQSKTSDLSELEMDESISNYTCDQDVMPKSYDFHGDNDPFSLSPKTTSPASSPSWSDVPSWSDAS